MAYLKTRMGNLKLDNPVIISSGHFTRTGKDVEKCDAFGAGAIITKSSFLEKEYCQVVKPYASGLFPDARAQFHSTGDGYLSICGLSPVPVESWAKWFRENIKGLKTPVIASIMAISPEGYIKAAKIMQESGAAGIEILLACPLPYLLPHPYVGGASFNPAIVLEVCSEVRKAVDIPVGVKLMYNPLDTTPLGIPLKTGLDWITTCVAFLAAPGINIDTIQPDIPSSVFLAGSTVAKHTNFVSLLAMHEQYNKIHISATGGTRCWQDIIEYIMYGAGSVQIQTLFLERGLGMVKEIKQNISDYIHSKKFDSIEDIKGIILGKLVSFDDAMSTYPETKGKIVAVVNNDKCIGCGLCEKLCNWDAVKLTCESLVISVESCEGCGLCVCGCPEKALYLKNVELISELAKSAKLT